MFKIALLDCVDGGWGICPFFCVPKPGDLTAQQSQPLGICYPRQKMLMPGGKLRGGVEGGGLGAAGID